MKVLEVPEREYSCRYCKSKLLVSIKDIKQSSYSWTEEGYFRCPVCKELNTVCMKYWKN